MNLKIIAGKVTIECALNQSVDDFIITNSLPFIHLSHFDN